MSLVLFKSWFSTNVLICYLSKSSGSNSDEIRYENRKTKIPNLVDVVDNPGMLIYIIQYILNAMLIIPIDLNKEIFNSETGFQAQLDELKELIMKTLGKGKQKEPNTRLEDDSEKS